MRRSLAVSQNSSLFERHLFKHFWWSILPFPRKSSIFSPVYIMYSILECCKFTKKIKNKSDFKIIQNGGLLEKSLKFKVASSIFRYKVPYYSWDVQYFSNWFHIIVTFWYRRNYRSDRWSAWSQFIWNSIAARDRDS